jgi:copper chaperone
MTTATVIQIEIDNLKCGGCATSIVKGLSALPDIANVEVDHDHDLVKFEGPESARAMVTDKLRSMGYPEKGTLEGLSAGLANAKSFVSCAIGRIS